MSFLRNLRVSLILGLLLVSGGSFAALNGTYTIDASAAASSTNYKSFGAIFGDLYNGTRTDGGTSNGLGVTGPVTINVVSGTGPYTEQVTVFQISGVSSTNKITVNGNGNTLQFTATSTSSTHTVLLNGADYVTFDNLKVLANSATLGRCFHLMNDARSNVISNCTLQMPNITVTAANSAYVAITQGTSNITTFGVAGQDNIINKCIMNAKTSGGPFYGIAIVDESSGSTVRKNTISNNTIKDWRNSGIFTYYAFQQTITGNEIHNTGNTYTTTSYGIYNYCYNKGGDYTMEDNYIHDLNTYASGQQYGIYHYNYYGTGSGDMKINRNRIILMGLRYPAYGMYIYGFFCAITGVMETNFNTIDMEQSTGTASYLYGMYNLGAYYQTGFRSANIDNNWVRIKTAYYAYGIMGYIYYNSQFSKRASISNNIVDCQVNYTLQAGIYAYCYSNNAPVDVCYNTIYSSNYAGGTINGTKYLMYMYYVDGNIKNNNLVSRDNGGTVYGIFEYFSTGSFGNNNIYSANLGGTFNFGARNNAASTDLAAYKTNFADANGMSIDPRLKNIPAADYTPTSFNFVNKGLPVSGFTVDFANVTRNTTTPDVGALEYYVDVAVTQVYFTGVNVCGGYKEVVKMTMKNNTTDTVRNVPVMYTVSGKAPFKGTIPKIAPNDTAQYTFTQMAEFNGSGTNTLIVSLDGTDDATSNNSITRSLNVTPSPAGFELVESTTFPGYFRIGGGGGIITNPDAAVPGKKVVYEIAPNTATGYTNSNYGSRWTVTGVYRTVKGTPVTSAVTLATPSGGNNATVTFDPTSALNDSLIYLNIVVKNLVTGCDSSFGRHIYVPHIPIPSFNANNVCEGDVAVFTNKSTLAKGTISYKWKFNDLGTPEDSSTIIDPVFNFSTYGNYNVVLTAISVQFPKFETTFSKVITVTPVPTIDFKVLNACEKTDITFKNNTTLPIAGTITYDWDFGDPTTTADKSTLKEPKYKYSNPQGYKVRLRATANGCSSELIKNANQFATPTAMFSFPTLICDKTDVKFTNSSTIELGNMGYTWSFDDGGVSNFANPTHRFTNAITKNVKLKAVSEFGCADSIIRALVLTEAPKADFSFTTACNLTPTVFKFTGTKPAGTLTNFTWDFAGEGSTTLENPTKLFSEVGKKMVTLTATSQNNCTDVITKEVNVKLQSKADFEVTDVCEDDDAVFINRSKVTSGNLNYNWKFGDATNSASQSPRHRYDIKGVTSTYNVVLVAVVPGGCSDSISKSVTINAKPKSTFKATTSGRLVYFTPDQTTNISSYSWRFGDGGNSSVATPQYEYLQFPTGKYQVCLSVKNINNCTSETCQTVQITGGVDKLSKLAGVKVYPNPNKGNFTVTVEEPKSDISISVYNLLGDIVKVIETNSLKASYSIDLNVANGIYLVKVTNGGLTSTQKVTINK